MSKMVSLQRMSKLVQLILVLFGCCSASSYQPHIIIITADDIGFNDVAFQNPSTNLGEVTKYLNLYANSSLVLNNYYVMPNGHSTRSALLTGQHPAKLGTQFDSKDGTATYGLDRGVKILPEYLKELGYKSHAVGQWDLGFYSDDLLPTARGYDSFYGSYLSYGDYTDHQATDEKGHSGYDLHYNDETDRNPSKEFKTEVYGERAVKIIEDHDDKAGPLHLYVALQSAQIDDMSMCGMGKKIPNQYYYNVPNHVSDELRRCYLALLNAADLVFGKIMKVLKNQVMIQNSIVIFTSTSGGPAAGSQHVNGASNHPFRGTKKTGWEGGVRGVGMIYSDRIPKTNKNPNCLFHVTDWLPTIIRLYEAAAGSSSAPMTLVNSEKLYGIDQYHCMVREASPPRDSIVHFLYGNSASMVKNGLKIVVNTDNHLASTDEWYNTQHTGRIGCGQNTIVNCDPSVSPCLYNIYTDPCERKNLATNQPTDLNRLMSELSEFNKSVRYDVQYVPDMNGDPANFGHVWQPWIDSGSAATGTISHSCLLLGLVVSIMSYALS